MLSRIDAYEKVTGRAIYADDISLPNMLYAKQIYSEHPHAKILKIDASEAKKLKGVIDIITADECPGSKTVGQIVKDYYILAFEKVRCLGDVVAVVAAENYKIASDAAKLIKIEYEALKPVLNPLEALKSDSPKVHDDKPNNTVHSYKIRHGDTEKTFSASEKVFEAEFHTQYVEHAYLEPESCVAISNPDETITVSGCMQHPFTTRKFVSSFLGLPLNKVQIIQTTVGGAFGGKDDTISVICARAALLALRTKRPVKITLTREESILESYKRHPFNIKLKMAVDDSNKITALQSNFLIDGGPYCSVSPFVIWRPTVQCTGPYLVPNVKCDSTVVYTNNPLCGAMRGFGTPQYNFAVESFMDIVADKVGLDPVKFRRLNFFKQGDIIHTGQKLIGHTISISQVVNDALAKFGWDEKFKKCSRGNNADGKFYGVGMSCSYRGVSLGAEGNDLCAAIINIQPDGSVILEVGVAENGQGLKTAMTRILCAELGLSPERVIYKNVDTNSVPDSQPTVASRGTLVGGNAVLNAARQIKELMAPALSKLIGSSKNGYSFTRDKIINPKTKKETSFGDAVKECFNRKIYLYALGMWNGPKVHWDEENGSGDAYFTYVYGCNAVELEVTASTGKVRLLAAIGAHDCGRAINPQMVQGQIYGGMMMGMGQALTEEIIVKDGKIENLNYNKYRIARSTDAPDMQTLIVENPDPAGPWGAKSIGEPVNELMAGAIANAVYYATGFRASKLPIKPEDILNGVRKE